MDGKIVSSDKRLEQALESVRSSKQEAERFAADPEAYLESKGVETDHLRFGGELSESEMELVAGGMAAAARAISVCASVGCVVCATVGGDAAA
jgi:hypothetical protein